MKTKTVKRLMERVEVYGNRTVLNVPMTREFYDRYVAPRAEDEWTLHSCIKDITYEDTKLVCEDGKVIRVPCKNGHMEILIKVFDRMTNHYTARFLRKMFIELRRNGLTVQVKTWAVRRYDDAKFATALDNLRCAIRYGTKSKVDRLKQELESWPMRPRMTNWQLEAKLGWYRHEAAEEECEEDT
jgi:hypothetical protein